MNDLLRTLLALPLQASTYARAVDTLHYVVIGVTMAGATFVFLLALYFLVRHRQKVPGEITARIVTSASHEAFIAGSILALFLAFWVVGSIQYDHMMTPPDDAMPVYVSGKQWMWKFAYADGRETMDELVVPIHKPIKLVMTSRDVIHSFYVPAFRMKHDVVPGRYYTAWFEATVAGDFPIECAEYCGISHSRMLGTVRVLGDEDYRRWLDDSRLRSATAAGGGEADLAVLGRTVAAERACFNCHTFDGQPHIGPTWARLYESRVPLTDGRTIVADEAYLTRSMMDPQVEVVAGFKPVMPSYRGLLPEPEVAALVEFIRSLRNAPFAPTVDLPRVAPLSSGRPQEPRP
jgi:cytochrome c oxidase subunit 2